jgi:hypothetical protein
MSQMTASITAADSKLFNLTCFIVWKLSVPITSTYQVGIISFDTGGFGRQFGFDNRAYNSASNSYPAVSNSDLALFGGAKGPIRFGTDTVMTTGVATGTWYCTWFSYSAIAGSFNVSGGNYPQVCNAWHMGTQYLTNYRVDGTTAGTTATIGCNGAVQSYFSGDMPEVLFYNRTLSYAEQLVTINYIKNKYGFTFTF